MLSQQDITVQIGLDAQLDVFATRAYNAGETVLIGKRQRLVPARTRTSFQMEFKIHVELDAPACWIAHSCAPNTGVRNNRFGGYDFVALRDIALGEKITYDYDTTETVSISVRECCCGAPECRGRTRGYVFLPEEVRARYGEYIAGYLIRPHQELQVVSSDGPSGARLVTTRAYRRGEVIRSLPCHSVVAEATYLTIQIAPNLHIDQIDVFGFTNHSCAPNTILDVATQQVYAARDLEPGEELTFFYPSTEWEMARPFECCCGEPNCLGWIAGAKELPRSAWHDYFFNDHIHALRLREQKKADREEVYAR